MATSSPEWEEQAFPSGSFSCPYKRYFPCAKYTTYLPYCLPQTLWPSVVHHCTHIWRGIFGNGLKRSFVAWYSPGPWRFFAKNVSAIDLIMILASVVLVNSIHERGVPQQQHCLKILAFHLIPS